MSQPHPPAPSPSDGEGEEAVTLDSCPTARGKSPDGVSNLDDRVLPERWQSRSSQWDRLKPDARRMRQEQTPAEAKLWSALRNKQVAGLKFRRQHAVDRYIVDFYCHEMRLVIEVDGPTHDATVEEDTIRQQVIEDQGIRVLRFGNGEVFEDLPSVLERIMYTAGVVTATASVPNGEQASPTSPLLAGRERASRAVAPPPRRTGRGQGGGVLP